MTAHCHVARRGSSAHWALEEAWLSLSGPARGAQVGGRENADPFAVLTTGPLKKSQGACGCERVKIWKEPHQSTASRGGSGVLQAN